MEEKNLLIPDKALVDVLGAAATLVLAEANGASTSAPPVVVVSGGFTEGTTAASTVSLLLHLALQEEHS